MSCRTISFEPQFPFTLSAMKGLADRKTRSPCGPKGPIQRRPPQQSVQYIVIPGSRCESRCRIAYPWDQGSSAAREMTALPGRENENPDKSGAQANGRLSAGRPRRRRLSSDQQREIARLYAAGTMETSAIQTRYSIEASSFYRILKRHRIPLRGRRRASEMTVSPRSSPTTTRSSRTGTARRATRSTGAAEVLADGHRPQNYRIDFVAERVFEAPSIQDAIRQAEAAGAMDISSIARED
jgi:hypothetical protein